MTPQVRPARLIVTISAALLLWPSSITANPASSDAQRQEQQRQEDACADLPEDQRRARDACLTDEERREVDQQRRMKQAELKERPEHTSFLKWVHIDGLWVPTTMGATTYGLIGTHVAVANLGRVYFFGPPGFMLLLDSGEQGRRVRPALSWGVSLYITDFRMPGTPQDARLFFNLAKCWTMGDQRTGLDMAGLSVTWKK